MTAALRLQTVNMGRMQTIRRCMTSGACAFPARNNTITKSSRYVFQHCDEQMKMSHYGTPGTPSWIAIKCNYPISEEPRHVESNTHRNDNNSRPVVIDNTVDNNTHS